MRVWLVSCFVRQLRLNQLQSAVSMSLHTLICFGHLVSRPFHQPELQKSDQNHDRAKENIGRRLWRHVLSAWLMNEGEKVEQSCERAAIFDSRTAIVLTGVGGLHLAI